MAGFRTNALVALGSRGFVVFSMLVGQGDPTRIAAQVVSGPRINPSRRRRNMVAVSPARRKSHLSPGLAF